MILIIIISSSIWAAYDAHKHRISITQKPYSLNTGWLAWLISCLLLWIFIFPYYLIRRFKTLNKKSKRIKDSSFSNNSVADELLKLKQLFDQGIITQEEFNELKKKKLG